MPAGMDRTSILIRAQLEAAGANDQCLLELGEKNRATHRWLGCRGEQAMVSAGVQPGDGGGSETTDTVGLEPFTRGRLSQVGADEAIELDEAIGLIHAVSGVSS